MKIALVADWLTNYGGAESVISAMTQLYPNAPVFTTLYKPERMKELGKLKNVHTTWLNRIPFARHQWLLSLMPTAVERMDLDDFDVVLSSCHSVSKGVITKPETLHISYCHTPMRYAWESWDFESRLQKFPRLLHGLIRRQMEGIRAWDFAAAQRVDAYLANSALTAARIHRFYGRESTVLSPPVDIRRFKFFKKPRADFFLAVGRLIPYKKFDLLIETCGRLKLPLKIVGQGPDGPRLRALARPYPTIEFLGQVQDTALSELYAHARAFLFPQLEDAGIVPLEAMASGTPVIAYGQGGALDTLIDGKTGLLFLEQTVESLSAALKAFEDTAFDRAALRRHAETYDVEHFKEKLAVKVQAAWKTHQEKGPWVSSPRCF